MCKKSRFYLPQSFNIISRNLEARTLYRHVHKVGPSVASGAHLSQHWALILGGVEESGDNFISAFSRISQLVPCQTDIEERLSDTRSD